jgi:tripartite-type tricarboxylate transporter receptor subunit TctC
MEVREVSSIRLRKSMLILALASLAMALAVACGSDPTAAPPAATATTAPPTATLAPGVTPDPTATKAPATAVPTPSFDAAAYFKGKTIRYVIPFNPGGGTDVQARFFAANLSDYLPGSPRVVISNSPPQDAALNRIYNNTKPDGFTILMTSGNRTQAQYESEVADFKFDEFRFINTFGSPAGISFVGNGYAHKRLQNAVGDSNAELIALVDGTADANSMLWAATSELLNVRLKLVLGSGGGTAPTYAAFDRGEINLIPRFGGILWYTVPTQRAGYIADGTFEPFCRCMPRGGVTNPNSESALPDDVMNPIDLMEKHNVDPEQIANFELLANVTSRFAKMLVMPPGTPDHIVNVFRKAWDEMLAEPELNAAFAKLQGQPVIITPGAEIEEVLAKTVPEFGEMKSKFAQYSTWAEERLN